MPESLDSWPGLPLTFSKVHGPRQQLELRGAGGGSSGGDKLKGYTVFSSGLMFKKRNT